jgi:signal transduction histidine kinase
MLCDGISLTIIIADNGRGIFPTPGEGTGLSSMKQRAESMKANLVIENLLDRGAKVVLKLAKNTLKG